MELFFQFGSTLSRCGEGGCSLAWDGMEFLICETFDRDGHEIPG